MTTKLAWACVGLFVVAAPAWSYRSQDPVQLSDFVKRTQKTLGDFQNGTKAALVRRAEQIRFLCRLNDDQVRRLEVAAAGVSGRMFAPFRDRAKALDNSDLPDRQVARDASQLIRDATEVWDKATDHRLWKNTVRNTLTEDQYAELSRNTAELDDFRRTLFVYQVTDEVQRQTVLRYTQRTAIIQTLKAWVAENGIPSARPNPRTKSWWSTLPEEAQDQVRDVLEPTQRKGRLAE